MSTTKEFERTMKSIVAVSASSSSPHPALTPIAKFIHKYSLAEAVAATKALISKFYEVDAEISLVELGGRKLLIEAPVPEAKLSTPRYLKFVRAWNSIVDARATDLMVFSESLA